MSEAKFNDTGNTSEYFSTYNQPQETSVVLKHENMVVEEEDDPFVETGGGSRNQASAAGDGAGRGKFGKELKLNTPFSKDRGQKQAVKRALSNAPAPTTESIQKVRAMLARDDTAPSGAAAREYLKRESTVIIPSQEDAVDNTEESNPQPEADAQHQEEHDEDEEDVPPEIRDEITMLTNTFDGLELKYRLIDKIGEGTFSTVYKAEDITGRSNYLMGDAIWSSPDNKRHKRRKKQPKTYVALKRIYVTSSPQRIFNELNLLYMLANSDKVAPLLEALRHEDQIIAVLPYYPHSDFREFFRDLPIDGIRVYMFELFEALNFVHKKNIIHRDIKPTNFLYDPWKKRGVLVDFGLAEQENKQTSDPSSTNYCPCIQHHEKPYKPSELEPVKGYPKDDSRPARRANRAGTRGFRAPEVLFKCPNQTTKIDVWSAGIILLTLLSRRFPFFNSPDDVDALVELTSVFGLKEMQDCANLHGLNLDTTLNTLEIKRSLPQIIYKALKLEHDSKTIPADSVSYDTLNCFDENGEITVNDQDSEKLQYYKQAHKQAFEVMQHCFQLNYHKRSTSSNILSLPFFEPLKYGSLNDEELLLVNSEA